MKPSPKPTPKPATSKKTGITIALVIMTLIIFGSLVAINISRTNHQKEVEAEKALIVDKATFAQAEADMDKAYAEIIAAIGKPEVEEKTKSCARSEQKFSQGNMSCRIMLTFAYPESSVDTAVFRTLKVQDTLKNTTHFFGSESGFNPQLSSSPGSTSYSKMFIDYNNDLVCSINYHYSKPELHSEFRLNNVKAEHITYYQFGCSKDVELAVYSQA